jgi:hypothetical protein
MNTARLSTQNRTRTWTRSVTTLRYTAPLRPGSVVEAERDGERWRFVLNSAMRPVAEPELAAA